MQQSSKTIISLFLFTLTVLLLVSCLKSTEPAGTIDDKPDTTSHNFTWTIDTVGSYGSLFRDVAVINDTLIYACGEIKNDEREQYGLAIWNGKEWKLKALRLSSMSGGSITPDGMYPETENKIWFASGSIFLLNGSNFSMPRKAIESEGYVRNVWASSKDDIWFVGTKGLIIHYDGSSFTTVEKLTDIELTDVWGTGPDNVWVCGYTMPNATIILHYDGSSWSIFHEKSWNEVVDYDTTSITGLVNSLWTDSKDYVWLHTYAGLYKVNSEDVTDYVIYPEVIEQHIWIEKVRGAAANDLVLCGDFTAFWHFNGKSIFYYPEFTGHVSFQTITTYKNNFYIVGQDYSPDRAIIVTGQR